MTMTNQMHRFTSISFSLMFAFSGSASAAITDTPTIQITNASKAGYEYVLNAELDHWLNIRPHFDGERGRFLISTRIDSQSGIVIVELGREFGPYAASPEMEDIRKEVRALTEKALQGVMEVSDIDLRFGGGTIYDWFPELQPQAGAQYLTPAEMPDDPITDSTKVIVSAGHGVYYHHKFKKWTTQRDAFHSVLEDNITQDYAERLGRILKDAKGNYSPIYTRSFSSDRHEPSGFTWREMSARYWLQHEYPNNPEIWHSVSSDKEPLREKFEDLYSRPLFANHIGAAAAISLHTNAEPSGQARPEACGLIFRKEPLSRSS
jgi:N-acetylmuramoyl-L-alanine amidase